MLSSSYIIPAKAMQWMEDEITMSMFDNDIIKEEKKCKKTKIQNYQDTNNKLIIHLTNEPIEDTSIWLDMTQSAAYIIVSSLKIDMSSKT